jgi:hypothetical protein
MYWVLYKKAQNFQKSLNVQFGSFRRDGEFKIKPNYFLRLYASENTVPRMVFCEKRQSSLIYCLEDFLNQIIRRCRILISAARAPEQKLKKSLSPERKLGLNIFEPEPEPRKVKNYKKIRIFTQNYLKFSKLLNFCF